MNRKPAHAYIVGFLVGDSPFVDFGLSVWSNKS